jgi:hypothetical protein
MTTAATTRRRTVTRAKTLSLSARPSGFGGSVSATERKVRKQLAKGVGILKVAKSLGIGTGTVRRISKEFG